MREAVRRARGVRFIHHQLPSSAPEGGEPTLTRIMVAEKSALDGFIQLKLIDVGVRESVRLVTGPGGCVSGGGKG